MSADLLFKVVNMMVLPAWLLLIILPRWRFTQIIAFGVIIPILSVVYTTVLLQVTTATGSFVPPDFSSVDSVIALLSDRYGFVAGWTHYLAFDLFVGAWIVRDAQTNRVPHLLIIVPLFFTFMAGPMGLFLYMIMRQIARRELPAEPSPFANSVAGTSDS